MTNEGLQILLTLANVIPKLSEPRKEWLLGFGEGMAFALNRESERESASEKQN